MKRQSIMNDDGATTLRARVVAVLRPGKTGSLAGRRSQTEQMARCDPQFGLAAESGLKPPMERKTLAASAKAHTSNMRRTGKPIRTDALAEASFAYRADSWTLSEQRMLAVQVETRSWSELWEPEVGGTADEPFETQPKASKRANRSTGSEGATSD